MTSNDKNKASLDQKANQLIQYFQEHQLTVNSSKIEFMIFSKKRKEFKEQIIINSIAIDEKPEALVLSRLHYSAAAIHAIEQNLIVSLEKEVNWALRATNFRQKQEKNLR